MFEHCLPTFVLVLVLVLDFGSVFKDENEDDDDSETARTELPQAAPGAKAPLATLAKFC